VMIAIGLLVAAASVYLVYVLEILKFRRLDAMRLRLLRPEASPAEIEMDVAKDFETGEFKAVTEEFRAVGEGPGSEAGPPRGERSTPRAQQRVGERQVDQDGVGAGQEHDGAQSPITADGR
jgi:hypothetical protein